MASAHYDRGTILYNQRNYKLAIKEYRDALQAEPNDLQALRMLAMSLSLDKQHNEAQRAVKDLLARSPDDSDFQYIAGLVYFNKGLYKEAEKYLKSSLAKDARQPHIFFVLAKIEGTRAAWKKMRDYAQEGLAIEPNDVKCLLALATAETKLGNWKIAQTLLERALSVSPNDAKAHAELGHVLLKTGKPDAAREHLREALRLDPNCSEALDGFIESLRAKNKVYYFLLQSVWFTFRGNSSVLTGLKLFALACAPVWGLFSVFLFTGWVFRELATFGIRFDKEASKYLPAELKRRNTKNLLVISGIFILVGSSMTVGFIEGSKFKLYKVKSLIQKHRLAEAGKVEKEMLNEMLSDYRNGHLHTTLYHLEELKTFLSEKEHYEPRKLAWVDIWIASKHRALNEFKEEAQYLDEALSEANKAKDKDLIQYIENSKK